MSSLTPDGAFCYISRMSLMPEKSLSVSPQLAATLGLEEALLYQLLGEFRHFAPPGQEWLSVDASQLSAMVPFWQVADLRRILANLQDKGVIALGSGPFGSEPRLRVAFGGAPAQPAAPGPTPLRRPTRVLDTSWQPARDITAQLNQYGIPRDFIDHQIAEFVTYWSERGDPRHSWNAKFLKHVLRQWREDEVRTVKRNRETAMVSGWQPSPDAVDLLNRQAGINRNFIEDAIPEFILYWRERGDHRSTWNTDFVRHVKTQWARYTATLEHDSEPKAITRDWRPSEDLFEVLQLANIPRPFAEQQVPEFVLYWRDSGQIHNSWNTRFLQHVKRQWARRGAEGEMSHEKRQGSAETVRTRDRSLVEDLTDRSWAN